LAVDSSGENEGRIGKRTEFTIFGILWGGGSGGLEKDEGEASLKRK